MTALGAIGSILLAIGALIALAGLIFALQRRTMLVCVAFILAGTALMTVFAVATGNLLSIFLGPLLGALVTYANWQVIRSIGRRDKIA